jgi:transcriptional regulator with XRE-family HTH domain
MESLAVVFGKRGKLLRKQAGLTQEQLGRMVHIDYKYLGARERGEKTPSFPVIERLAKTLDVDFYQLFLTNAAASQIERSLHAALQGLEQVERPEVREFLVDLL